MRVAVTDRQAQRVARRRQEEVECNNMEICQYTNAAARDHEVG